jgi:hypothetical protein
MKSNLPTMDDQDLTKLLRGWKVSSPVPARFEADVWQRIAAADNTDVNLLTLFRTWLAQAFARPTVAFTYAAVLLLAGALSGLWQAQTASERVTERLEARYVQSIDPYQMPR